MNPASLERLSAVHPDLQRVIHRAAEISEIEFIVTEGARTIDRQRQLLKAGATTTLRSRHVPDVNACGVACAVDLAAVVDGEVRWDWPLYNQIAAAVKEAARIEGVAMEWGGDWIRFKDGPHFQLPWAKVP